MKSKMWIALGLIMASILPAKADGDRMIDWEHLPAQAREFLTTHFEGKALSLAKEDRELFELRYEVVLVGGEKIEFSRSGVWEEVSCRYASIPSAIVPHEILSQVQRRYPEVAMTEISRERNRYEVQLANGMELIFDRQGRLIGWDD